jgi:hypothetical protein
MQRSPPAYYLAFNIFMWGQCALQRGLLVRWRWVFADKMVVLGAGVLLCCQAAAKNFGTLAALRVLSGA